MADRDIPKPASSTEKSEGDGWTSESDTVERVDRDRTQGVADSEEIVDRSGAGTRPPRRYDQDPASQDKAGPL
ncbi:MAG: hypothetical protein ABIX28_18015 [Vicinamibacterales bacterium]